MYGHVCPVPAAVHLIHTIHVEYFVVVISICWSRWKTVHVRIARKHLYLHASMYIWTDQLNLRSAWSERPKTENICKRIAGLCYNIMMIILLYNVCLEFLAQYYHIAYEAWYTGHAKRQNFFFAHKRNFFFAWIFFFTVHKSGEKKLIQLDSDLSYHFISF